MREHILIVEDSRMFGTTVARLVERELQADVVLTRSLAEAQDALKSAEKPFDVALLDLNLPDAPNGEIVGMVRSQEIPVVVFTANFSDDMREDIWSHQVVDYIIKEGTHSLDYLADLLKRLHRNQNIKVMVVDDSSFARQSITNLLAIQKFDMYSASNGNQALSILCKHPDIKLILTDYQMPDMNGFELTREIRRGHKKEDLAIIGVSGVGNKVLSAKFLKNGANDFIIKPFLTEELYCRVNQNIEMLEAIEINRHASYHDFLTGLFNRRYLFESGAHLHASATRNQLRLTAAMIDVDFFKKVNDQFGHEAGDLVLKDLAENLRLRFRDTDIVARIGGEEFCVLAINMAPDDIEPVFNNLRTHIAHSPVLHNGGKIFYQVSIGVCTKTSPTLSALVTAADEQLYMAKNNGRNQVCID